MNNVWKFEKSKLSGVYTVSPFCSNDNRGYFLKDYTENIFSENGVDFKIKETFYSFSYAGTIRGMHFQREKQMGKLVRCISGKIYDVICDLRLGSETFGKWVAYELSSDNMTQLLIPGGFAHGFLALEDSLVSYKCDECFCQDFDDGVKWNDCELNIKWPIKDINTKIVEPIISLKDQNLQSLREFINKYKGLK